jgi:hypothetical protein
MRTIRNIFLRLLAITLLPHCCLAFYANFRTSGLCDFQGYRAVGSKAKSVPKLESKNIKSERMAITAIVGYAGHGTEIAHEVLDGVSKVAKVMPCPKLGASLGIVSAAFDAFAGISELTPDDIYDATDVVIERLTKEIDDRFQLIQEYVDHKVISSKKDLLTRILKSLTLQWRGCAEDHLKQEDGLRCQRFLANEIGDRYHEFLIFIDEMDGWKNINFFDLDFNILHLEALLFVSRDYINLGIKVYQTVVNEYSEYGNDKSRKQYYLKYLEDLKAFTHRSVKYIEKAYFWIRKFHKTDGSKYCQQSFRAGGLKDKHVSKFLWWKTVKSREMETACVMNRAYKPVTECRYNVEMLNDLWARRSNERKRDKNPRVMRKFGKIYERTHGPIGSNKYDDFAKYVGKNYLLQKAEDYYGWHNNVVENFWYKHLTSIIPTWKKTIENAKSSIKIATAPKVVYYKPKCDSNSPPECWRGSRG